MYTSNFYKKYHEANLELLYNSNFQIDLLRKIHFYIFDSEYDLRILLEEYSEIEKNLSYLLNILYNEISTKEYLDCVEYICTIIYDLQPFYDGNTRLSLVLHKLLLNLYNIDVILPCLQYKNLNFSSLRNSLFQTINKNPEKKLFIIKKI